MHANRRSATRHDVVLAVTLTIDSRPIETTLRNLSLGGALIEASFRPPLGTRLALRFWIPEHEKPIEVGAEVRWTTDGEFGVQFDGLRAAEVWSLGRFLQDR